MKALLRIGAPLLLAIGVGWLWWLGQPAQPSSFSKRISAKALGQVRPFVLTNQFGRPWSSTQLAGRVWVADVFFSRCPGPCVQLAQTLRQLQAALPAESRASLVSLTVDAAFDTPEVLRRYAHRWGATSNRWVFLTGPQALIYRVATEQLRLAVGTNPDPESAAPAELFVHSTRLALVDGAGRVRAFFDGEDPDVVPTVVAAIRHLEAATPRHVRLP